MAEARKRPARPKTDFPDWMSPNFNQPKKTNRKTEPKKRTTTIGKTKWSGRTKEKAKKDVLGY
jgi:hypothetical protein